MQSMLWTALSYNPVRILGLLGLAGLGIAGVVLLWTARAARETSIVAAASVPVNKRLD